MHSTRHHPCIPSFEPRHLPTPFTDAALSAAANRAGAGQGQVEKLKAEAYKAAVDAFIEKYAGLSGRRMRQLVLV